MEDNEKVLDLYKKYDNLSSKIRILVGYIKPSFLFKTQILTPIHLGKSIANMESKDGKITEMDFEWLNQNCISDNDFESNISHHNRRIGFLTGTYWAWKNYHKINNPEYFGFFGYRRLLYPDFLEELDKYDLILPKKKNLFPISIKEQLVNYHGENLLMILLNIFENIYPNQTDDLNEYLNNSLGYFDEIYIMKKDLFFDFCCWIFPLVFEFLKTPQIELKNNDLRDIGFIMERLTGFYLNNLTLNKNIKYKEEKIFMAEKMVFNRNIIDTNLLSKLRKRNLCTK